ncbi:VOC family protein [Sphingomonas sp. NFR15]|uniref:VOC family protein n=1 Tax=Sphingomonas sp. NFR15 TaxID=1566282 RepID=UPI000889CF63|nr:VOC family protein [Sphingomonas sp. NFR15]SDA16641.1 Catechol 2,3-dioxygenase [Sphingomonas sp. NFR15]
MFTHIMLGADDLDASQRFYDATLGALGIAPARRAEDRFLYAHDGGIFIVIKPINGEAASCANGGTIGFRAVSAEAVDAWHAAGLAHGGSACEDPPGHRDTRLGRAYSAYLRDPAGNKLCAAYRIVA